MRLLEIITLRSTGSDRLKAALEVLEQMAYSEMVENQASWHSYRNAEVESDLCIHLLWDSEETCSQKSPLGLRLAHLLRDFGFIHHAIWIEEKPVPRD